jgi:hypothetical protein
LDGAKLEGADYSTSKDLTQRAQRSERRVRRENLGRLQNQRAGGTPALQMRARRRGGGHGMPCPYARCLVLYEIFSFLLLEVLHDFAYVLRAVAGADQDGVVGFDYYQVIDADGGYEFFRAPEVVAGGV